MSLVFVQKSLFSLFLYRTEDFKHISPSLMTFPSHLINPIINHDIKPVGNIKIIIASHFHSPCPGCTLSPHLVYSNLILPNELHSAHTPFLFSPANGKQIKSKKMQDAANQSNEFDVVVVWVLLSLCTLLNPLFSLHKTAFGLFVYSWFVLSECFLIS